ncbi:hypothetical protein DAEQUDRAFT_733312 [Daedalea quercina L-15889]|uniref:Uncharacterized protein n=1 Tax=Daedalea quercina L-15889 TaxID=1314783 RepID=A0A165L420_9APHY|nr:hypothetical protein DAEQUDRAFT_733312 [Daedalea quercina L-15889]
MGSVPVQDADYPEPLRSNLNSSLPTPNLRSMNIQVYNLVGLPKTSWQTPRPPNQT